MPDCSADLIRFHDDQAALPRSWLDEMRRHRDTGRARIAARLRAEGISGPIAFRMQGSVAMGTVIAGGHYGSYDMDDGLYLSRAALTGPRGGEVHPLAAREMVRAAAHHGNFADPPEVRRNCVRVYYSSGFHVDVPVYRVMRSRGGVETFELASSEWRPSDPLAVTRWFKRANARSAETGRQRQLVRIIRYAKMWTKARSRQQYGMLGGFGVTILVVEAYHPRPGRDDVALFETMSRILERLRASTVIAHPSVPGAAVPARGGDAPVRAFARWLEASMARLDGLRGAQSREEALLHWDSFFHEDFFGYG